MMKRLFLIVACVLSMFSVTRAQIQTSLLGYIDATIPPVILTCTLTDTFIPTFPTDPSTPVTYRIDALNSDQIFIGVRTGITPLFVLLKSLNGGVFWNSYNIQYFTNEPDISAVDANTIWGNYGAYMGTDLHAVVTINGGTSWTDYNLNPRTGFHTSSKALDANTFYIAHWQSFLGEIRFTKTTNGGGVWNEPVTVATGIVAGDGYLSMFAVNANLVYITFADDYDIKIAKSVNAGANWDIYTVETGTTYTHSSVWANAGGLVYVAYTSESAPFSLKFARSTDGGLVFPVIVTVSTLGTMIGSKGMLDASITDPDSIFITYSALGNSYYARSIDGGFNWCIVDNLTRVNSSYTNIDVISPNIAYGAVTDTPNRTVDFVTIQP